MYAVQKMNVKQHLVTYWHRVLSETTNMQIHYISTRFTQAYLASLITLNHIINITGRKKIKICMQSSGVQMGGAGAVVPGIHQIGESKLTRRPFLPANTFLQETLENDQFGHPHQIRASKLSQRPFLCSSLTPRRRGLPIYFGPGHPPLFGTPRT